MDVIDPLSARNSLKLVIVELRTFFFSDFQYFFCALARFDFRDLFFGQAEKLNHPENLIIEARFDPAENPSKRYSECLFHQTMA